MGSSWSHVEPEPPKKQTVVQYDDIDYDSFKGTVYSCDNCRFVETFSYYRFIENRSISATQCFFIQPVSLCIFHAFCHILMWFKYDLTALEP
jgi:hypothetical protein